MAGSDSEIELFCEVAEPNVITLWYRACLEAIKSFEQRIKECDRPQIKGDLQSWESQKAGLQEAVLKMRIALEERGLAGLLTTSE